MYFIRNLILITIVSLLSGCIMGSPYGGAIFVGPIDFIKIIFDSKDERISPSNNTRSEPVINYYNNQPRPIKVADITLNQEDILSSKTNIGSINFTFPDENEYKILLDLVYQNDKNKVIESEIYLIMNNKENKLPLVDYEKRDIRYPDYKLSSANLYIFSKKNNFSLNITFTGSQSETKYRSDEEFIIKNNNSTLKSKITTDEKDYKIEKITYH